ncbi:sensor histidine kinase [Kutzneria kofuensis]|uniref:histidine kinase n=1 Tax=Kutzneria kofuensis TaxID=103725 RepID=A0A7W9KHL5_9PSEU|nr:histidine kinase [Kutzneria kofuensis]MBB5892724.1 signal transduction histidine kinase [Kutzneria kofuensis]
MENGYLGWRALARRQWPLATALVLLILLQMVEWRGLDPGLWWQLPFDLVLLVLAVVSPRRPFDAALAAAVAILSGTVILHFLVRERIGGDIIPTAAGMAMIAIVVRQASRGRATAGALALIAANVIALSLDTNIWDDYRPIDVVNAGIVFAVLFGVAVGTGLYFRARDRERRQAEAASVAAAQQAERLALARELHDVVAHYVTGIVVHSQAAQAIADQDPEAARSVLPIITASGHEALTAMRRLVGTLRGTEASPTSRDNDELAAQIKRTVEQVGGPVRLDVQLSDPVPPELAQSVIRLVQESLTNARKHAAGVSRIDVDVRTDNDTVRVRVADDGTGQHSNPAGGSGGFGLVGMRERVELLGGSFSAGPTGSSGWTVVADLPLGG